MPDATIPELKPESVRHPATSPRCRFVSIRRLVRLLFVAVAIAVGVAVAVAVLPLRTIPSADSTRLHRQTPGTIRRQALLAVAGSCGCLMLDALSSHSQSPIISKHLLPPRRCVSVGGPAASLWPYHKNGGRASDLEGSKHCGQTTSKFKKFTPPKFNIAPPCRERPDQMSQAATAVLATERSTHTADTVSGWTRALGTVVGTVVTVGSTVGSTVGCFLEGCGRFLYFAALGDNLGISTDIDVMRKLAEQPDTDPQILLPAFLALAKLVLAWSCSVWLGL